MKSRGWVLVGLFLLSASVLAFQVLLTRIFSFITWYHFAYMIVSIALLGYGSAGIAVTLKLSPETSEARLEQMRKWALTYALAAPGAVILISRLHFYPLARGLDAGNLATLLIYYTSIAGVLFAAGVTVVTGFKLLAEEVGLLYFADLSGAAFGSLMVLGILPVFGGFGSAALVGLLGTLSSLALAAASGNPRRGLLGALAAGAFCGWIMVAHPFEFPVSASKNIFTWQKPYERESAIEWTSWNPIARVDVTRMLELPIFTTGGAMGAPYVEQRAFYHVVMQDGASPTAITVMDRPIEKMEFLDGYLQTCTYILNPGIKRVMAIGSGGGVDILIGLFHGATELVAVEINPDIANLLRTRYRDQTGGLAWLSNVQMVVAEGRHYMARPQDPYDLIQLSASDTNAAASSGAFTFAESYLYTVEAAHRAQSLLRPGGLLSFSRYAGGPPKDSLRLVAVLRQAGEELGLPEARERTVVLSSETWIEIVVGRDPFSTEAVERLHEWAGRMGFQVIYDPFHPGDTPYHAFLKASGPEVEAFYDSYPFDVRPPTDDRPFLMQFYKFSNLPQLFWARNFPLAWTVLLASLVQIGGLSIAGLLWPVLKDRQKLHTPVPQMIRFFIYFACLGLAFIVVEVSMMQKLIVFLGGPTRSFAVTLFSLLLASGVGSYLARDKNPDFLLKVGPALPVVLVVLAGVIGYITEPLLAQPDLVRYVLSGLLLAIPGVLMGMPFPLGLKLVESGYPDLFSWAWAVNAFCSVLGSILTIAFSMVLGFGKVLVLAAGLYVVALVMLRQLLPVVASGEGGQQVVEATLPS